MHGRVLPVALGTLTAMPSPPFGCKIQCLYTLDQAEDFMSIAMIDPGIL